MSCGRPGGGTVLTRRLRLSGMILSCPIRGWRLVRVVADLFSVVRFSFVRVVAARVEGALLSFLRVVTPLFSFALLSFVRAAAA